MRVSFLVALLLAAFTLPASAVQPVKGAVKGTGAAATGVVKGTAQVGTGVVKGTGTAARGVGPTGTGSAPAGLPAAGARPRSRREGRVVAGGPEVPAEIRVAVAAVLADLAGAPFLAPEAHRLTGLGLGRRELAAAVRAGALLRVADGIYLRPGADTTAAGVLAGLPQPFTLSEARQALGTSRRVAVPLLELLDARGLTRRRPDDRRTVPGHE